MSTLPLQYMKAKSPQEAPTVDKILCVCSTLNNLMYAYLLYHLVNVLYIQCFNLKKCTYIFS